MAGIYVHIPFCKQACYYCNFHFSTSTKLKNDVLDALLKEIELRRDFLGTEPVETIYFGGGTPSMLSHSELNRLLDAINTHFRVARDAEITLEANPDDISREKLQEWKHSSVNRLSIGVQSFFEEDLRWMNRVHSAGQAITSINLAQDEGLPNITIDLIFGGPTLTDEHWQQNVEQAINLGIPHLSCYGLTVEPGTSLEKRISRKITEEVNADDQARQFLQTIEWLSQAGYEQYEISNYALPGHRSIHNSSYWQGKQYAGFGPSAHSFNGLARQWNIANNALYIQSLQQCTLPFEIEILTDVQKMNEWIMISLRRKEGINLNDARLADNSLLDNLISKSSRYLQTGLAKVENNALILTNEGKLYADRIAADLFFEENEIMAHVSAGDS